MHLSFLDYLRTGELPPIVFGTSRTEVLRLLGIPTDWCSKDDPLFQPPRNDYRISDSFSFGSITFSFDSDDTVESIFLNLHFDYIYPTGSLYFPSATTSIDEVADLMRGNSIRFEDMSSAKDGSELGTASGVLILMSMKASDERRIISCISGKAQTIFKSRPTRATH